MASDPKKLRELMKKEKERRQGEAAPTKGGRPVAAAGARGVPPAVALANARAAAAAAASASAAAAGATPAATGATSGASVSGGSSSSSSSGSRAPADAPDAKRPRTATEADSLAMPPPPVPASGAAKGAGSAAADSLAMPPPPVPGSSAKIKKETGASAAGGGIGKDGAGKVKVERMKLEAVKVEAGSAVVAAAAPSSSLVDYDDDAISVAASEDAKDPAAEGAEGEVSSIPEGFFDNPDREAEVRGVEAPTVRKQRELEEGLKKFEKEMIMEVEKAEETRHDIDEEKYEKAFEEEQDYQSTLQGRLHQLRKKAAEKLKQTSAAAKASAAKAAAAPAIAEAEAAANAGSGDEDSGSDVEFDWRAKGFG